MNLEAPISSVMTKSVETVSPDQKLINIKHIYEKQEFHSHIPVIENDKVVGVVSLIDFMRAIHNASLEDTEAVYHDLKVRDIMSKHPVSVTPDSSIRDVAEILSKGEFHSLLILSNGKLEGIITTTDIIRLVLKD